MKLMLKKKIGEYYGNIIIIKFINREETAE